MIIEKKDFKVSEWSGGTTSQILIFPKESDYVSRSFDLRISSATIDIEESVFTNLNGYRRILYNLGEEIQIEINSINHTLGKYERIDFDGSDSVISRGKTTDFNIIFKPNINLISFLIDKAEDILINDLVFILKGIVIYEKEQMLFENTLFRVNKVFSVSTQNKFIAIVIRGVNYDI
jgi:hypothetical protein